MATVKIDHWGNRHTSSGYIGNRPEVDPEAYIVLEPGPITEGVNYICYANTANRAIKRVTAENITVGAETWGQTTIEWAYGAWADRAALIYKPINEFAEVTE